MKKKLQVDQRWCAKCRMCAIVSNRVIQFDTDGYPAEIFYDGEELKMVKIGVAKCPANLLKLI